MVNSLIPDIFIFFSWFAFLLLQFQILLNPSKDPIVRESAAAYTAGFLARKSISSTLDSFAIPEKKKKTKTKQNTGANFVKVSTVVKLLDLFVPWLHSFIDYCEKSNAETEPHRFSLFYYACQALFYIICYRYKDLLALEGGSSGYISKMGLERIIQCKFNPLKICSLEIVNEFAEITNHYQLAYCFNVIERNKKIVPAGKALLATEALSRELQKFYVFEPLDLAVSKNYVKDLYQEYSRLGEIGDEILSPKGSRRPSANSLKVPESGISTDDDSSDFLGNVAESVEDRTLADRLATSVDPFS